MSALRVSPTALAFATCVSKSARKYRSVRLPVASPRCTYQHDVRVVNSAQQVQLPDAKLLAKKMSLPSSGHLKVAKLPACGLAGYLVSGRAVALQQRLTRTGGWPARVDAEDGRWGQVEGRQVPAAVYERGLVLYAPLFFHRLVKAHSRLEARICTSKGPLPPSFGFQRS